jgi:hypothetical protein
MGHASAIYNTQRQSTIALNVALLTTIVAGGRTISRPRSSPPSAPSAR